MWTTVRNFLRPFHGVHKKFLSKYIAICEFVINLKSVTTEFISQLVNALTYDISLIVLPLTFVKKNGDRNPNQGIKESRNQGINGMNACRSSPKSTPNPRMEFGGYECLIAFPAYRRGCDIMVYPILRSCLIDFFNIGINPYHIRIRTL